MPTYIKVGYEPRNKHKMTSRGFFIRRIGNTVSRKWGAIEVSGHTYKKIHWANGYPMLKLETFKTTKAANEFIRVAIRRKLSRGYEKISVIIKNNL